MKKSNLLRTYILFLNQHSNYYSYLKGRLLFVKLSQQKNTQKLLFDFLTELFQTAFKRSFALKKEFFKEFYFSQDVFFLMKNERPVLFESNNI